MSGDLKTLSSQHAVDKAALENKIVVYPESNQLQVDIDSDAHWDTFNSQIRVLGQRYPFSKIEIVPSETKGHLHITVTMAADVDFDNQMASVRLLLQACLGSDLKRASNTLHRTITT